MSETSGVNRTKLANGLEFAFIDKGVGKLIGIPREQYEANGYQPPFESLPEKED
ncbi:hypothetical protein [Actibacterium lipolyticum]|uniref:Uncharacterized protein n=1 Tax=Actibacterium lipolyticum TaxID=1524263 RepID=A0A238KR72_9RHOB|nr:hypothetical protein [Actibacterium lipolyticum]SMX45323.1 hypothetical protein COL8621_02764 [Actibacterium lipolyticum]